MPGPPTPDEAADQIQGVPPDGAPAGDPAGTAPGLLPGVSSGVVPAVPPAVLPPAAGEHGDGARGEHRSSARTRARKMALDILFESEMRGLGTGATLADRIRYSTGPDPSVREVRPYTITLVEGVRDQHERIDELLSTYSRDWTLERMPGVDRAILRIGVWELLHNRDVPPPAVISEAVGLASSLSTDASPGFVNGLLARIADLVTDA